MTTARIRLPSCFRTIALLLTALVAIPPMQEARAAEGGTVDVLILREQGGGSAASAQKFIDDVMVAVAKINQWDAARGTYHTERAAAEAYVAATRPHFGIVSLAAFLALREKHELEPLGKASVRGGGGEQYFVVSKVAADLGGCKGKTLATTFTEARFVDEVVLAGAATLADFEVVALKRPLQAIKAVARDEAVCALIDDAQLAELERTEGGAGTKAVWSSSKFPSLVVVAFPSAPANEAKAFKRNLGKVCEEGKAACEAAGLRALVAISPSELDPIVDAYDR